MSVRRPGGILGTVSALVLGLVLTFSLLVPIALAAGGTYPTFVTWQNDNITRISTVSDVHFGESNTRPRLQALIQAMQDFDPQMLLVSGDTYTGSYNAPTTDPYPATTIGHSFGSSYDEIKQVAHYYLGDIPVVVIAGNHDYEMGSNYYTTNSGFSSYYGLVPTKNFDIFLFGAPNAGTGGYSYSADEISALDAYLSQRDDQDKPVFVESHYPVDDAYASTESHGNAGNAAAVIDVLDNYDQPIFYLWGHNHNNAANRDSIGKVIRHYSTGYATMYAGAVNYRMNTAIAQGMNMTIDLAADELNCRVIRIDTSNSGVVTEIGTYSQGLPIDTPGPSAEKPTITAQPQDVDTPVGGAADLAVAATVSDGGTLSYQWFSNTNSSNTGGASISGAASSGYSAPTSAAGTKYYYCEVTNTVIDGDETDAETTASDAARVEVLASMHILSLRAGWNLVAAAPGTTFPGALFGWSGESYESTANPASWAGYWCKVSEDQPVTIQTIVPATQHTIVMSAGWNLIGNSAGHAMSLSLAAGRSAFVYDVAVGAYESVLTLLPGQGAWVRGEVGEEAVLTPIVP